MLLKWIFDRLVALIGLLALWPVFLVVALMIRIKMPDGPIFLYRSVLEKTGICSHAISFAQ